MTQEIEAGLLIRTQLRLHCPRQWRRGDAPEFRHPLSQRLGLLVAESLQSRFVKLCRVEQGDLLLDVAEDVESEVRERLVRGLNRHGVQLHPAAVRKLDEPSGRGLQAAQVRRRQLHSFLLPFGRDGKPVDTAPANNQFRTKPALRQEQSLESRVAKVLGGSGAIRPGDREGVQEALVCVTDPKPRLRCEPVEPAKPTRRGLEPRVVEDFWLVGRALRRTGDLPLVTVPLPDTLVPLAPGQQTKSNDFVAQFEDELRNRGVRDAKLIPISPAARPVLAEVREQSMAQSPDRQRGLLRPMVQQVGRRGIPEQEEAVIHQHDRWKAGEETRLFKSMALAVGQLQLMGKREFRIDRFKVRRELGHLPVKGKSHVAVAKRQSMIVPPPCQPPEKLDAGENQRVPVDRPVTVRLGQPLDELPVFRREKFLFVGGARGQLDDLAHAPALLAGPRAEQRQFDSESAQTGLIVHRVQVALYAQSGAGRVKVHRRRGQEPAFQLFDQSLFLLGLLDLGESFEVGVGVQLDRKRTLGAHEQQSGLLQPRRALGGHQPRPPVFAREVLSRERQALEIVFQEKPRALGVGAVGKGLQEFGAFGHRDFGVGQLAPQVGESAVSFIQHDVVGIVLWGGPGA